MVLEIGGGTRRLVRFARLAVCMACAAVTVDAEALLEDAAARIRPGDFARIEATLPPGTKSFSALLRITDDHGKSWAVHGWSDSGQWDPVRRRAYFLGVRKYQKFICFDDRLGEWQELGWAGDAPSRFEPIGHVYGRTALDARRGHYYRLSGQQVLYRYLIDAGRWESLPGAPVQGYISMDWHGRLDKLVALSRGGGVYAFRDGEWDRLGRSVVDGYHSLARFNPVRGHMLLAGGNKSPRKLELVDAKGALKTLNDAPHDILIKNTDLTYDPSSGNYLVLWAGRRQLYEFDADRDEWRLAADWSHSGWPLPPDPSGAGLVPIVIDELGVILWLHESGPYLYRHRSVF